MRGFVLAGAAVAFLGLLIGGCAHASWVPANPSVDSASFEPTKARCDYIARHGSQSGFYAAGNPNFVAGAAIGHGIGTAVTAAQDFDDCMIMSGWMKVQKQ
jgi:hypothetical protein